MAKGGLARIESQVIELQVRANGLCQGLRRSEYAGIRFSAARRNEYGFHVESLHP